MSGIPFMHHPHHVPQKSTTTYRPLNSDSDLLSPFMSTSVKSGAGLPTTIAFLLRCTAAYSSAFFNAMSIRSLYIPCNTSGFSLLAYSGISLYPREHMYRPDSWDDGCALIYSFRRLSFVFFSDVCASNARMSDE